MGKLTNLLKWNRAISIKDEKGQIARDENGNPIVVYMRVIGDHALEEASRKARLASAIKRVQLLDPSSEEYLINIKILDDAEKEQCTELILQGQTAGWTGEAYAEVTLPDLPKIEEIAINPDAPTLEELEKLDKAIEKSHEEYRKELETYVKDRQDVLRVELESLPIEELRERARQSMVIILSIDTYLSVLRDEKVWQSVYQDDKYTLPEFDNLEQFLNLTLSVKDQLREEYERLEAGLEEIKN